MPIINKGILNSKDAYLRQVGNDWPTAQVTTTSDVIESTSNLYFTAARVNATVQPFLTAANIANFASTVNATVQPFLTTANVTESGSNLYFTNTRVIFAAIPAVTELTVTTPVFNYNIDQYAGDNPAIYVSAGETIAFNLNVSGSHPFNIRVSDGGSNYNTGLTHIAQNGTISTESSAQGKVTGKLFWKIPYVLAGNTYVYQCTNHGSMVGNIVIQRPVSTITTDNVTEGSNLYFTNTRARSAFSAGENIAITPEGVISATAQSAVVSNDNEIIVATANTLSYALSRNITDPRSILVIDEGLIQIPITDYTTSASTITFSTQPVVNSNIEIRYFGIDSVASYSSTFFATVNTFVGTGSNVTFPLSITPVGSAYTSVIIDGVTQQTTAYSIVGNTIEFTEAPVANAVIDVRIYSGTVGSSFNTRTFVGNGVANTYAVTSGFNAQNILVFENGVAQVADVDYTVDANSVITFAAAPAANIVVQIRELGSVGANLINQISGRDLRSGNIEPFVNEAQNLGSANLRYNKIFLSAANSLVMGNTTISISGGTLTLTTGGTTTVVGASGAQGSTNARTLGYSLVFGG